MLYYYNVGTGTAMAGQTMAGFYYFYSGDLPNLVHLMCVLVSGLNSVRLSVYSCDHAHGNLKV